MRWCSRVCRKTASRQGRSTRFSGLDRGSQALWTADIRERQRVFTHAGNCYRSTATFNPKLKRYFWVQILPQSRDPRGPRFQGGFAIYEAPEPWGPWRTVSSRGSGMSGQGKQLPFRRNGSARTVARCILYSQATIIFCETPETELIPAGGWERIARENPLPHNRPR